MPSIDAGTHVGVGRGGASARADVQVTGLVVAGVVIAAAAVLAWTAAGAARPRFIVGPFTELVAPAHDIESHVVQSAELLRAPVRLPHRYPDSTGPGITTSMHQGFAPQWSAPSPAIGALPAEEAW